MLVTKAKSKDVQMVNRIMSAIAGKDVTLDNNFKGLILIHYVQHI